MIFKNDESYLAQRTKKRVYVELFVLLIICLTLISEIVSCPVWLTITVIVGGAVYILGGLALYPLAKKSADSRKVVLSETGLRYSILDSSTSYLYSDIDSVEIKRAKGFTCKILLKSKGRTVLKLAGLENMELLSSELLSRINQ